jgi:hypothetical protein
LLNAAAHRPLTDSLAPFIEQGQLAAGLTDAPAQPFTLLRGWPVVDMEVEDERFLQHSQIPVCYVVVLRTYSWLMRRQEGCLAAVATFSDEIVTVLPTKTWHWAVNLKSYRRI